MLVARTCHHLHLHSALVTAATVAADVVMLGGMIRATVELRLGLAVQIARHRGPGLIEYTVDVISCGCSDVSDTDREHAARYT